MALTARIRVALTAIGVAFMIVISYQTLSGPLEAQIPAAIDKITDGYMENWLSGYKSMNEDTKGEKKTQNDALAAGDHQNDSTPPTVAADLDTSAQYPVPTTSTMDSSAASANDVPLPAKGRNAIVTAVWDANYASMALMLGWSIQQHNNLTQLNAELVLLTLDDSARQGGLTAENRTRLEKIGWKIKTSDKLDIPGINIDQIVPHRRLNLNKLQQFGWAEYDKVVYIDADSVCKSSFEDLFSMPGEFAAAPDVWFDVPIDTRFNSGVMVFKPSAALFNDMMGKLPRLHNPHEGDQDFLQQYWQYRDYKLPFKFNLNIVMHEHYRAIFDQLWEEAAIVHYTIHKPSPNPELWCVPPETGSRRPPCVLWPILTWYREYFTIMRAHMGFQNEIDILGAQTRFRDIFVRSGTISLGYYAHNICSALAYAPESQDARVRVAPEQSQFLNRKREIEEMIACCGRPRIS